VLNQFGDGPTSLPQTGAAEASQAARPLGKQPSDRGLTVRRMPAAEQHPQLAFTSVHKTKRPPADLAAVWPGRRLLSLGSGDRIRTCDLWVMSRRVTVSPDPRRLVCPGQESLQCCERSIRCAQFRWSRRVWFPILFPMHRARRTTEPSWHGERLHQTHTFQTTSTKQASPPYEPASTRAAVPSLEAVVATGRYHFAGDVVSAC
jgi:hypothetical protein